MTTETHSSLSVTTVASITEVPAKDWDPLAPRDPMASHGWLRLIEEEAISGVETRYVLVHKEEDLIAAAPCYICHEASQLLDPDVLMYGRFRSLPAAFRLSFVPSMFVGPFGSNGPIRSNSSNLLVSDDLDIAERHTALSRLLTATVAVARSNDLPLHFPRIRQDDDETRRLLRERNCYKTRDFPLCYLDVEWDDFEGYLRHLGSVSRRMQRNVRHEKNRFRKSGVVIEVIENPAAHAARLWELANDHSRRLNGVPLPYSARFLTRLKKQLGDDAVFYGAFQDRQLIGFVILLKRGGTAYLILTGIDRRWTGYEAIYFNLCYYRPIQDAISERMKRLYFGGTLYRTKVRRGCRIMALDHCYLGASPAWHAAMKPWFVFHAAWMGHRSAALEDLDRLRRHRSKG